MWNVVAGFAFADSGVVGDGEGWERVVRKSAWSHASYSVWSHGPIVPVLLIQAGGQGCAWQIGCGSAV